MVPSSTTLAGHAVSIAATVVGPGTSAARSGAHPAAACSSTTRTVTFIIAYAGGSTGPFAAVKRRCCMPAYARSGRRFEPRLEFDRCDDGDGTEFRDDLEHRLVDVVAECGETFKQ